MTIRKSRGLVAVLLAATCATGEAQSLTADDRAAIQEFSASYMKALFARKAEKFADLFVPDTGLADSARAEPDPKGVSRLLTSGVRITAKDNEVTGRSYVRHRT